MVNLFRIADQHSTTQLAALYTDRCKPLGWSNLTWRTTAVLNLMELEYSYLLSAKTRLSGDYMAVFYKFKTYITICLLWRNTNSNSVLNFCESLLFWSWLFPCLLKKKNLNDLRPDIEEPSRFCGIRFIQFYINSQKTRITW